MVICGKPAQQNSSPLFADAAGAMRGCHHPPPLPPTWETRGMLWPTQRGATASGWREAFRRCPAPIVSFTTSVEMQGGGDRSSPQGYTGLVFLQLSFFGRAMNTLGPPPKAELYHVTFALPSSPTASCLCSFSGTCGDGCACPPKLSAVPLTSERPPVARRLQAEKCWMG